jgi:hypothetical protein
MPRGEIWSVEPLCGVQILRDRNLRKSNRATHSRLSRTLIVALRG